MIWSIVCEWNYSSWCVVFWVWITSRNENYFFLSGKQNSVRNVSENIEVFRLFRWTFVNSCFYLPIFVGVEILSEHKDHEKNIIITRPAQAIQCKFSCNDLILLFQQSTNSSTSFQINIQHVEQQQQQSNLIASVLATRI